MSSGGMAKLWPTSIVQGIAHGSAQQQKIRGLVYWVKRTRKRTNRHLSRTQPEEWRVRSTWLIREESVIVQQVIAVQKKVEGILGKDQKQSCRSCPPRHSAFLTLVGDAPANALAMEGKRVLYEAKTTLLLPLLCTLPKHASLAQRAANRRMANVIKAQSSKPFRRGTADGLRRQGLQREERTSQEPNTQSLRREWIWMSTWSSSRILQGAQAKAAAPALTPKEKPPAANEARSGEDGRNEAGAVNHRRAGNKIGMDRAMLDLMGIKIRSHASFTDRIATALTLAQQPLPSPPPMQDQQKPTLCLLIRASSISQLTFTSQGLYPVCMDPLNLLSYAPHSMVSHISPHPRGKSEYSHFETWPYANTAKHVYHPVRAVLAQEDPMDL
ncbi:hypothetical protein BKA70DRAFT_1517862 [Coprinopsis sp. MPI-PUGE-AT-0042]|nr:hypothetical protein BKA70DRAFT_1517862 [Coprinopsis sp. MPI-PUGE-AT-0042]